MTVSAYAGASLLVIPLLVPLWTGRLFAYDDLSTFHLPIRFLYSHALADGQSTLWTSALFGGFYLHAEGQAGALHPLHLLMYGALPLVTALNIELLLNHALPLVGMCFFLHRRGLAHAACAVGATAFAFSGFNLLRLSHLNAIGVVAHLPWLLIAIELQMSRSPRERAAGFGGLAALMGSQLLLGYPQYVWISGLSVFVYAMVRSRELSAAGRLVDVAGAAVLGLLIGAAQWLPTLDLLERSTRATVTSEFQMTFSLHPLNLLQLWCPYVFHNRVYAIPSELIEHELGVYNGALCTVAFFWALARWRHFQSRTLGTFALWLCVAGILLALGRHGLLYEPLRFVPVVGSFRAPARYVLLLHLGLAILLALTVDDLMHLAHKRRRELRRLAVLLVPVTLTVAIASLAWLGMIDQSAEPSTLAWGVALLISAAFVVAFASRGHRWALLLLPLFSMMDLGWWGYSYAWKRSPQTFEQIAARADLPAAIDAGTLVHEPTFDQKRNLALLHGLKVFRPYVGLAPSRVLSSDDPETLRLAGVVWVKADSEWNRVHDTMPRVRLLFDARPTLDPAGDLHRVDMSRTALVSATPPPLDINGYGQAVVIRDEPGTLELKVTTSARALLATTESYHRGWRAASPQQTFETMPLYGDFLGVLVEPGEYPLTLEFKPASSWYGSLLSTVAAAFTLALAAWRSSRP